MFEQFIKPMIIMIIVIILCAIIARNLSGGETLSQYAEKRAVMQQIENTGP